MVKLNKKQRKTLDDIFTDPVKSDILWDNIENLFNALGAELSEGRGSRIRIFLHGIKAVFHRPHPRKETDKGAVKSIRRFLIEAGVNNVKI